MHGIIMKLHVPISPTSGVLLRVQTLVNTVVFFVLEWAIAQEIHPTNIILECHLWMDLTYCSLSQVIVNDGAHNLFCLQEAEFLEGVAGFYKFSFRPHVKLSCLFLQSALCSFQLDEYEGSAYECHISNVFVDSCMARLKHIDIFLYTLSLAKSSIDNAILAQILDTPSLTSLMADLNWLSVHVGLVFFSMPLLKAMWNHI